MSALGQKQTLMWVFDMIESVGKVLKLVEHHHETSPSPISASGSRRCRAPGRLADRKGTNLSDAAGAHRCGLSTWRTVRHRRAVDRPMAIGSGSASHSLSRTALALVPI